MHLYALIRKIIFCYCIINNIKLILGKFILLYEVVKKQMHSRLTVRIIQLAFFTRTFSTFWKPLFGLGRNRKTESTGTAGRASA